MEVMSGEVVVSSSWGLNATAHLNGTQDGLQTLAGGLSLWGEPRDSQ